MRVLAVAIAAVLISTDRASAQTGNARADAAADDKAWSAAFSAYIYILSDDQHYVQPTVSVDRGHLHLESRYNYESLDTGSAWLGVNFSGGKVVEWTVTPMFGAVFGDTTGAAPGLKGSLAWKALEFSAENEYVIDADEGSDSFFYNWSEFTLAPASWWRFGVVTQRTRVYQSDRELQRGLMVGVSVKRADFTAYVFNPDEDKPRFVFATVVTF
jgi:hypothetical protein